MAAAAVSPIGTVRDSSGPITRRLAAVWFADIVGYVSLSTANEKEALRLVRIFQRTAREVIEEEGGYLVKFIGDEVLAEFGSTLVAVAAGFRLREVFAERAREAGQPGELRIGMHVGDVATSPDGDIYGEGVNVAARLTREADPDGILVSEDVWRQLRRRPDIRFEERGVRELKGVDEPIAVYAVTATDDARLQARVDVRIPRGTIAETTRPTSLLRGARLAVVATILLVAASGIFLALTGTGASAGLRGGFALRTNESPFSSGMDPRRIAVRYFEDRSSDDRYQFLADGLTEDLITELSRTPALDVVSRNGVAGFRDPTIPRDSVAQTFRAGTLVEGYIEPIAGDVRVAVALIDGESGAEFSRQQFRVAAAELATVRDSVLEEAHLFLRQRLGGEVRLRELQRSASTPAAWAAYQRGERTRKDARELLETEGLEHAAPLFERADSILAEAERLDPSWTAPTALRGEIAYERSRLTSVREAIPWIERGLAHAERALERDANNPRALELRGTLRYWHWLTEDVTNPAERSRQLQLARQDLERAVDLDESRAGAHNVLGHLYLQTDGEQEQDRTKAIISSQKALQEDAYSEFASDIRWRLFTVNYDLRPPDVVEARRQCLEGYRHFPADPRFTRCQLILAATPGSGESPGVAWDLLSRLDRLAQPGDAGAAERAIGGYMIAAALGRANLPDSASHVLARTKAAIPIGIGLLPDLHAYEAYAQLAIGDTAAAIDALTRIRASDPTASFEHHWRWDGVRNLPEFAHLRTDH